jgi:hypothetical protein
MYPALAPGDVVVARKASLKVGDIVIAHRDGIEIIKRVKRIEKGRYYVVGDNPHESTDSRHYGFISKNDILGTIMIILPKAVNPPKPIKPYGITLGRIAAVILIVMALIHLFRIDTFLPILDTYLPGGGVAAGFMGVVIIFSEVFAVPFALRMKLSPLAHMVSGALLALAPLWWLLIDIWMYGLRDGTGQLGGFVAVPSTTGVLLINLIWVAFNYYTLYTLGYNRLKIASIIGRSR